MSPCPQVMGHLKDALLVTLDDVQLWVVDGLDGALDQLERLSDAARAAVLQLQDTQVGRAAASGLDDVLSRLEDATAYYLPLPPTLREYRGILGNCGLQVMKCIMRLNPTCCWFTSRSTGSQSAFGVTESWFHGVVCQVGSGR